MAWEAFICIIITLLHIHISITGFLARISAGLVENERYRHTSSLVLRLGSVLLQGNVSYGRDEKTGKSIHVENKTHD